MNVLNAISGLDPRALVGNLVQDTVGGLTGNDALGRAAGLVADIKTGNLFGAIQRGGELVQNSFSDIRAEVDLRWGPGAHLRLGGTPVQVAESCPAPEKGQGVELNVSMGLFGWSMNVRMFGGDDAGSDMGNPASVGASDGMKGILNDPSLSLEAKVALLFADLIDDLDEQIEGKLGDLDNASRAQQQDKASGGDGESAGNDLNRISTEVQMLMQKRSQMYGLQSNMMAMFNDVSTQIINNVR